MKPVAYQRVSIDQMADVIMEELMSGTKRPIDLSVVEDMAY